MNPTQLTGTIAFLVAALMCASRGRGWWFPTVTFALGVIELQLNARFRIHDAVEGAIIGAAAPFADKHHVQYVLIAIAAVIGIATVRRAGRMTMSDAAASALIGLTVIETISLHAIDHVLYTRIGPVMLIGWFWAALSAVAAVGARRSGARTGRRRLSRS